MWHNTMVNAFESFRQVAMNSFLSKLLLILLFRITFTIFLLKTLLAGTEYNYSDVCRKEGNTVTGLLISWLYFFYTGEATA